MSSHASIKELQNMQIKDLAREVQSQRTIVAKLRLGVKMQKEKNTSKYVVEKKHLARMLSVLSQKRTEDLQSSKNTPKVSPPQESPKVTS